LRIAIVGFGPRGLSALERIICHTRQDGPPVELLIIEPNELGVGIHKPDLPDYLQLNTIAAQLTIFSDPQMVPGQPVTPGPSLYQWCVARGQAVRFDDFLPRSVLGQYLQWAVNELVAGAPPRLTIVHLATIAKDLQQVAGGAIVTLADGTQEQVDIAIVTTGHGVAGPLDADTAELIASPYPLPGNTRKIRPGATVAVLGAGLTAMDVIAALTVGRGGSFSGGQYVRSGLEPRIVLTNRSGWLPCARPATSNNRRPAPAEYFTAAAIKRLRRSAPDGKLDFCRDVEPLVHREAIHRLGTATQEEIDTVEQVLRPKYEIWQSHRDYCAAIMRRARFDLQEAERGLGNSVVKEALEILRDQRDALREAVDAPGLTEESQLYFMTEYIARVNRVVIGPQKERIRELIELIDAGIVVPGPGPEPRLVRAEQGWVLHSTHLQRPVHMAVDGVVKAHLQWPTADPALDPMATSLAKWVQPGPGGRPRLALDRDGHVISQDGGLNPTSVSVFGPPAEGTSYYNHYVPSPGAWSRALTDLDRVIRPALTADHLVEASSR